MIVIKKINSKDDIKIFSILHKKAWFDVYSKIIDNSFLKNMSVEKKQKDILIDIKNDTLHFFLVFENKIPIGILILRLEYEEKIQNHGEIVAIYLLKPYWSKGIGKRTMDFAIDFFDKKNVNYIYLWVLEKNSKAITFYEKYGFLTTTQKKQVTIEEKEYFEVKFIFEIE